LAASAIPFLGDARSSRDLARPLTPLQRLHTFGERSEHISEKMEHLEISSREVTEIRKEPGCIDQPRPTERGLPLTWPDVLKLMMLLAGLWATMFGIIFVIWILEMIIGG
jgi:hypothetical protein